MRRVIYSMGVSLDGFIADRDGDIDWSAPDEELHRFHNEQARRTSTQLYGRRLYEAMRYWETAEEAHPAAPEHEHEFARIWKQTRRLVFSRTLETVEGGAEVARGDLAEEVARLKEQPGGDIGVGAGHRDAAAVGVVHDRARGARGMSPSARSPGSTDRGRPPAGRAGEDPVDRHDPA